MSWRQDAACSGVDTNLFFPLGAADSALSQISRAKQICGTCPVQATCLEWAERTGVDHGIWGGLSEDERRARRRRRTSSRNTQRASPLIVRRSAARQS